jgi:hypothetical protein
MSIIVANVVSKLRLIHLVVSLEFYKTIFGVIIQALGRINDLLVQVGDVVCKMDFMVVDTNGYDVMLGLDFFIKNGAVVDIKRQVIQICYGLKSDVQMLPLNMINMLQWINNNLRSKFQEL